MRKMKLHRLVEYLKSVEFYHDTVDLEDEGVRKVLGEYGIHDEWTTAELQELNKELYGLAEKNEFREAMKFAANAEVVEGMRMVEIF